MQRLLLTLVSRLPLAILHGFATLLAWLLYYSQSRLRYITDRNLEVCMPELGKSARKKLSLHSLVGTCKTLLESLKLWLGNEQQVLSLVKEVSGKHLLDEALHNTGAILVVPHLGNWEMVGLYCSKHYPMTTLYREQRNKDFDRMILEGRSRFGANLVTTSRDGVKQALLGLKQKKLIGILPDQNPGTGNGIYVPFFGVLANTPTIVNRLAERTNVPVFSAYAERLNGSLGFHIHIQRIKEDLFNKDQEKAVTELNYHLENLIRRLPEQYWWSHNRFRHRPEGEKPIY